jgi:hypothetical protein
MMVFEYQGRTFEDHGPECDCEACRKTQWKPGQGAVVLSKDREYDWYQVYGGPVFPDRESAANHILQRYFKC